MIKLVPVSRDADDDKFIATALAAKSSRHPAGVAPRDPAILSHSGYRGPADCTAGCWFKIRLILSQ